MVFAFATIFSFWLYAWCRHLQRTITDLTNWVLLTDVEAVKLDVGGGHSLKIEAVSNNDKTKFFHEKTSFYFIFNK